MSVRQSAVVAGLAAALTFGLLPSATAAPAGGTPEQRRKQAVDATLGRLAEDIQETSKELAAAGAALAAAEARLGPAREAVARTRGELAAALARDRTLAVRLRRAQADEALAVAQHAAVVNELADSRDAIGRIARIAYRQGAMAQLAVVLESQTPDEFATRVALVQTAVRAEGAVAERLADDRGALAAARVTIVDRRQRLARTKLESAATVAAVKVARRAAELAQARAQALVAARARAVVVFEREKAADEALYREMQAESRRLGVVLAERARLLAQAAARARARERARAAALRHVARPPARGSRSRVRSRDTGGRVTDGGVLARPVAGGVTSPYGMRVHPVTGVYKLHDGTDFRAACGTPIRAAAAGTVVAARGLRGYGNQTVLDHGYVRGVGLATSYSHQSRFAVRAGQRVARGQVIGYAGTTGYSTGCHLHFMVYVNGTPVDPMRWL